MKTLLKLPAIFVALAILSVSVVAFLPQAVSAVDLFPDVTCQGQGANSPACTADDKDNITGPDGVLARATTLIAIIGGIAAVIGLIIGGFQFVTSSGDSGKIASAKKTITYSLVGVVVIALARTIIVFVISRV